MQGRGAKTPRGGILGVEISAPHVGSVDDRGVRVDNPEDDNNMNECILVRHHQMYALAYSTPMMPPTHHQGLQFAFMFPYNHFLGFR